MAEVISFLALRQTYYDPATGKLFRAPLPQIVAMPLGKDNSNG